MQTMENLTKLGKLSLAGNDAWEKFQAFNEATMAEGAIGPK